MNKHKVKFIRGSKTIWDQLNTTPEKIDNNTLYFIYEDENYSVGKLYLGQRLITDDKIINIKDIGDIQIDDESLIDKQILIYNEENQEWKNSSLEEIIDLSNYYTKDEIDNVYHKTIISTDRPPSGAPVEVDVDLLRVGDTWILPGYNIVYKLVKAQYNYQPTPDAEPYHRFIWQPLNERYGIGNTEPPTSVTYQAVVYTINEVQWSWLPVPEYFKGDRYQMLGDGESTYFICVSGNMADTGVCTYRWREEGGASSGITIINTETVPESSEWGDSIPASYAGNTGKVSEIAYWEESGYFWGLCSLATDPITGNINYNWVRQADEIDISDLKASIATKMKLAPLNPTAQEIEAMPDGQLYCISNTHVGVVKGGEIFPSLQHLYNNYYNKFDIDNTRPKITYNSGNPSTSDTNFKCGDIWVNEPGDVWTVVWVNQKAGIIRWERITRHVTQGRGAPPATVFVASGKLPEYKDGDLYIKHGSSWNVIEKVYMLSGFTISGTTCTLTWLDISSLVDLSDYYTKTEIDSMIPTVPTNISAFTNDSGYLTLGTLPIYDGTVI